MVPGGLGRSRVISSDMNDQEVGKDLMNFYSMVGINFKNIANNDRMIVETINQYDVRRLGTAHHQHGRQ